MTMPASAEIAPADRRLYAIRHATATVESPGLITASILSKKLAGGAQALILDVKGGTGAFMKTRAEAKALAQLLVTTANAAGWPDASPNSAGHAASCPDWPASFRARLPCLTWSPSDSGLP